MIMPCPVPPSRCFPCFISPIANLSSENEDVLEFIGTSWNSQEPPLDPPNGTTWSSTGCLFVYLSTISQEDADLNAQKQQIFCNTGGWKNPGTGAPPTIYLNSAQSCTKYCADGLPYTFTVAAGTFAALSQVLADRMAGSYACNKAATTKVCLSALSKTGCVGSAYSASISLSNAVSPVTWEVTFGSLPAGLTLGGFGNIDVTSGATETIQGTPTAGGSSTFSIKATDSTGRFMEKQYTICIQSISPSTLPNGTIGTAYSQAMTAQSCIGTITWSATNLPAGLTINSATGLISGTPTGTGASYDVVITATRTGAVCSTHETLTINSDPCPAVVNVNDYMTLLADPCSGTLDHRPELILWDGTLSRVGPDCTSGEYDFNNIGQDHKYPGPDGCRIYTIQMLNSNTPTGWVLTLKGLDPIGGIHTVWTGHNSSTIPSGTFVTDGVGCLVLASLTLS